MYEDLKRPFEAAVVPALKRREGVKRTLDWIDDNFDAEFKALLVAFDSLIERFNDPSFSLSPHCENFHRLRDRLHGQTLPLISGILELSGYRELLRLKLTAKFVNGMMQRGEISGEEPSLRFQMMNIEPRDLSVGAIFHFTEECILAHYNLSIERGDIEGALIETLAQDRSNPLWSSISDKDKLNWVEGWKGFSIDFRKEHGFS